jgi:LysR family glycine cleavage system transcriptional activator
MASAAIGPVGSAPVGMGGARRIPPIQCLVTFEALARLRSVTLAAEELCVTPSAVSHRVKQLEDAIGTKLFGRADFSLTSDGSEYLAHVREGLSILERFPGKDSSQTKRKIKLAVTPTFSRSILMPRLRHFIDRYPEIDITLQVSIPLLDVEAEDADLTIRFGTGRYADVEHVCLMTDEVTPLASPDYLEQHGPFDSIESLRMAKLLKSPLEPWRTWFLAHGMDHLDSQDGSTFNDIGLMCDAAAQGLGIGLVRLKLAVPWMERGSLVRVSPRSVPSPHAHYLCWRTGTMDRWECAAFAEWLKSSLV